MTGQHGGIATPWMTPPQEGDAIEIASGVLWMRLPLPFKPDHVNIYAFDEGDSWTLVDTGMSSNKTRRILTTLMAGPLQGKPVSRVLLTHHHPDHVGNVGWFQAEHGAQLVTSRTAWLMARMLTLDVQSSYPPETVAYYKSTGMPADTLAARLAERPYNFADTVSAMPLGFTRLQQGDMFTMGGRQWDVHMGNGHAPEHVTLWSRDDNLVLTGDQVISSISPNLGVYATEPEADTVGEWFETCTRFAQLARPDQLCLGGHKLPFTGLPHRLRQLIDNHHHALDRLVDHLSTPQAAADCFAPLYKRKIGSGEYGLALVEAVAHCNHLYLAGKVSRTRRSDGAWIYQRL